MEEGKAVIWEKDTVNTHSKTGGVEALRTKQPEPQYSTLMGLLLCTCSKAPGAGVQTEALTARHLSRA